MKPDALRGATTGELLEELWHRFTGDVAKQIVQHQRGVGDEWVAQQGSPLGNRRHCAIVRRRAARGDLGAVVDGKRFLLSREALREEMQGLGRTTEAPRAPEPDMDRAKDDVSAVRQRLRDKWDGKTQAQESVRGRLLRKLGRA